MFVIVVVVAVAVVGFGTDVSVLTSVAAANHFVVVDSSRMYSDPGYLACSIVKEGNPIFAVQAVDPAASSLAPARCYRCYGHSNSCDYFVVVDEAVFARQADGQSHCCLRRSYRILRLTQITDRPSLRSGQYRSDGHFLTSPARHSHFE